MPGKKREHESRLPRPRPTVVTCGSRFRSLSWPSMVSMARGCVSYLARAEELGFEGGWTLEQTVGQAPLIAPMELLAWAAACTSRLRLGVAVLITSLHDPLQLASVVDRGRPAQPRPAGPRRRLRRRLPAVPRVRRGESHVHPQLHRGPRTHEGGLVRRAAGDVPRTLPSGRQSADPAQAGAAPAPADLVRRPRACGTGPRGAAGRCVPRRGILDHGEFRRSACNRAARTRTNRAKTRRSSPSANGST